MLYGRDRELEALERLYEEGRFEFLPVYGGRGTGKTALLKRFAEGRNAVYFRASEGGMEENLRGLVRALGEDWSDGTELRDVLDVVRRRSENERFLLIVDDYLNLARSRRSVGSTLRNFIDDIHRESGLFLVLCDSSKLFMMTGPPGTGSRLFSRRTGQMCLGPLKYDDARLMLDGFPERDRMRIYAMVGGIPGLLERFDPAAGLREYVTGTLPDGSCTLYETRLGLYTEFGKVSPYEEAVSAVARGLGDERSIADDMGIAPLDCGDILWYLCLAGIVDELCDGDGPSRYVLADRLLRFHHAFVRRHAGSADDAAEAAVRWLDSAFASEA